jgi:hypothetical protein
VIDTFRSVLSVGLTGIPPRRGGGDASQLTLKVFVVFLSELPTVSLAVIWRSVEVMFLDGTEYVKGIPVTGMGDGIEIDLETRFPLASMAE